MAMAMFVVSRVLQNNFANIELHLIKNDYFSSS